MLLNEPIFRGAGSRLLRTVNEDVHAAIIDFFFKFTEAILVLNNKPLPFLTDCLYVGGREE